jgi:hypothetical protein
MERKIKQCVLRYAKRLEQNMSSTRYPCTRPLYPDVVNQEANLK